MALEELWFGLEEALHNALHNLARLILQLILGRAEHLFKNADELGRQALDSGLVGFVCGVLLAFLCHQMGHVREGQLTKFVQTLIHRLVLLKVLLQRQEAN